MPLPDRNEILNRIQELMARLFELDQGDVVPEAKLVEDLDLDSIDAIDMIAEIQTMGAFPIDEKVLQDIRTVEDVVNLVEEILAVSNCEQTNT